MILQTLNRYAEEEGLVAGMDVKVRLVHLTLNLHADGTVANPAWTALAPDPSPGGDDPKRKKPDVGRPMKMPEFPGVNAGGKAYFLADACEKVLGVIGKTGEPVPDDPDIGGNATKGFLHFWQRVVDAQADTDSPELAALLAFRDHYLADEDARRSLPFAAVVPFGRDGRPTFCAATDGGPVVLDKRTITFTVGALGGPIFRPGTPIHDYWKQAFARERFPEAAGLPDPSGTKSAGRGVCLVTGGVDLPIAEVHRTLIKGVPGLPPIGGYLVSFDTSTPALSSYGFERGYNAPVSEDAAAAYALALNHILANDLNRRRFNDAVIASWIDYEPEASGTVNLLLNGAPTEGERKEFFDAFAVGGRFHGALDVRHYRSMTLAANGGRVVVRRWLDTPLRDAVARLKQWFVDLDVLAVESTAKAAPAPSPFAIDSLAATTARVPSEVPSGVADALYRAALEGGNPRALLAPVLNRLRIAAVKSGGNFRYHTSRFALIKLILIRSKESPMEITPQLCETTNDPAYNCGRLLAVLEDLQRAALGKVGANVVQRFYGNASTYPRNVFSYLLRLEKHHLAKLLKSKNTESAGYALGRRIDAICGRFPPTAPGGPPEFPALLNPQEQGRFALGFHQQKAKDDYLRRKASDAKKAADVDPEAAAVIAIEQAIKDAEKARDSD